MRRVLLWAGIAVLLAAGGARAASHTADRDADVSLYGPAFQVAGLKFTVPSKWISEPPENGARVAQWHVPPARGHTGEGGEVVVVYFGAGIAGTAKDNLRAWADTVLDADGHAPAVNIQERTTNGWKIAQVAYFGTYSQVVAAAGIPPVPRPDYGLLGAAVEGPQGNLYWRFTGPAALITDNLPLFTKILDSVKPADKTP